jgi:hypothetical protein
MNFQLGLRALAILALVAASTVAIVVPELIGMATAAQPSALNTLFAVGLA